MRLCWHWATLGTEVADEDTPKTHIRLYTKAHTSHREVKTEIVGMRIRSSVKERLNKSFCPLRGWRQEVSNGFVGLMVSLKLWIHSSAECVCLCALVYVSLMRFLWPDKEGKVQPGWSVWMTEGWGSLNKAKRNTWAKLKAPIHPLCQCPCMRPKISTSVCVCLTVFVCLSKLTWGVWHQTLSLHHEVLLAGTSEQQPDDTHTRTKSKHC